MRIWPGAARIRPEFSGVGVGGSGCGRVVWPGAAAGGHVAGEGREFVRWNFVCGYVTLGVVAV